MSRIDGMPDWPGMMRRTLAARYCDLSVAEFEREVHERRLPMPVVLGRSEHWSRRRLDEAFELLDGWGDDWRVKLGLNNDGRMGSPLYAQDAEVDRPTYTVKALAERWQCSEGLVRKMIRTGELPVFRYGNLIRVKADVVAEVERARER